MYKRPNHWQVYPNSPEVSAVIADLIQDLEEDPDVPPDVRIVFLYQEEVLVNVPVVLVTLVP